VMQTSRKLKITTPASENQANFPQKPPKITTNPIPLICVIRGFYVS